MLTKLEQLLFRIGLVDKVSGPLSKIDRQIGQFTTRAATGFTALSASAVGFWGLQRALSSVLGPAIDMDRALGEVGSLGVADRTLKRLSKTALAFSIRYGEGATDIVRASYDIQSAIAGLVGNELAVFTEASGVLAKATKADVATITDYMGTMYGIFQNTAERLGRADWVRMVTGQTASAVQMFKTTGADMASAFSNLGAEGESAGIALSEQMAILGTLQATMSGSEAGTKYKAFLQGIGKAQGELGMQFTDSYGRMLPMLTILNQLQARFGAIDTVAEADLLKKAFGRKEAVALIKQLLLDTEGLGNNIAALGNVKGMDKAREMATRMADPFQRWQAGAKAVTTVLGQAMLPVIVPLVDALTAGNATLLRWSGLFPHVTKAVGGTVLAVMGLVAVVLTLSAVGGLVQLILAGINGLALIHIGVVKGVSLVWRGATLAWALGTATLHLLRGALMVTVVAAKLFALVLMANPLGLLVAAIALVVAALAAMVYHWDWVKEKAGATLDTLLMGWRAFTAWLGGLDLFAGIRAGFAGLFTWWSALRETLENNQFLALVFTPLLAAVDVVALLFKQFQKIPEWFHSFKTWLDGVDLFEALGTAADWVIEKLNLLPGIAIDSSGVPVSEAIDAQKTRLRVGMEALPQYQPSAVPAGGISQQVVNQQRTGHHIEKVEIHQPVNGFTFADELAMAAG